MSTLGEVMAPYTLGEVMASYDALVLGLSGVYGDDINAVTQVLLHMLNCKIADWGHAFHSAMVMHTVVIYGSAFGYFVHRAHANENSTWDGYVRDVGPVPELEISELLINNTQHIL